MSEAVFVVPTVLWHGGEPTGPAAPPADFEQLVWQLDHALLLLELAGYQAREAVIDLGDGNAAGVDLLQSGPSRPPAHPWTSAGSPGRVGLWVGPRSGMGALEEPPGAALALQPVDFGAGWPAAPQLTAGFTPTAAGWLTLELTAGSGQLYSRLAPALDSLLGTLRQGIVTAYQGAHPAPGDVPTPGLLSMLDPSTWNVSAGADLPDPKAWEQYGPTLVQLGQGVRDFLLGGGGQPGLGLATFLAQETSILPAPSTLVQQPPAPNPLAVRRHSVLERLREGAAAQPVVDVQPGQWLAGMYAALRPDAAVPVTVAELDVLTWTELLLVLHRTGAVDFLSYRLAPTGDLYGGRTLRRGDTGTEVTALQGDLRGLGFTMIKAEAAFGQTTDWAVREFQIYAKMPATARWLRDTVPYADGLEQVPVLPEQRYPGEPTGVVDADTRAAIARWKLNNWRCPVVAEAWEMANNRKVRVKVAGGLDNLWAYDATKNNLLQVFVRDFSDYYSVPATHQGDPWRVVGQHDGEDSGGPMAWPPRQQYWPEAELLSDAVIGGPGPLLPESTSTFKAVRMVAEVECYGHLDSLTAYDNTFVSLGICHWTFGQFSKDNPKTKDVNENAVIRGELAGLLAYAQQFYAETFSQAVGRFGLLPAAAWGTTGQAYLATQRKYVGWFVQPDVGGGSTPLPEGTALTDQALAAAMAAGNVYRSWHWMYRWAMAARTMLDWRSACWDYARIRLRDVLATPWGSTGDGGIPDPAGGSPVRIGDVFTSERAVAMVLRWHVRFPGHIVEADGVSPDVVYQAAKSLRGVYITARGQSSTMVAKPPAEWTDDDEVLLIDGILAAVPAGLKTTMEQVRKWPVPPEEPHVYPAYYLLDPDTLLPIGEGRGSFQPDYSGLPQAPEYNRAVGGL